jgi:radical SAM superfamily enzyme YgiQ (UPF0313 family)
MDRPADRRALLVFPRFPPNSFWNYQALYEVVGARYSATPLGLITVAALLPQHWQLRLIDCNVEELTGADLAWADLVLTGGMLPQQRAALEVIRSAQAVGKPVLVGGPDVTCSPHLYDCAEFRLLGEAEESMADFLAAWSAGESRGTFQAKGFPSLSCSPVPRFDLLKLDRYMHVGIQVSRGCPFTCEFCNVIELNGRAPRLKSAAQVLKELDRLFSMGYRGHVDFVDDNLIGNRKEIKPILKELAAWVREHGYPFEFSTELSINVADDDELLALLKQANFFACFVGVETPEPEALRSSKKSQNVGKDVAASLRKLYGAGLFVNAGFIVGFDAERGRVADLMVRCIEEAAIPVPMVGLLYALPNTELFRRLTNEGRLHAGHDRHASDQDVDQGSSGLNFDTLRPRSEVLSDFREVLERVYSPAAYFGRVRRLVRCLDARGHRLNLPPGKTLNLVRAFLRVSSRTLRDGETRWHFLHTLLDALVHNPRAFKIAASMAALFLHYKPYSRHMVGMLAEKIESAEATEGVATGSVPELRPEPLHGTCVAAASQS